MKFHKKAQITGDWTQAFVVALLLVIVTSLLIVAQANTAGRLEKKTDFINEKIQADQILLDYLNTPINEFQQEDNNLFENIDVDVLTMSELISLIMSGNPQQGRYDDGNILYAIQNKNDFFISAGKHLEYAYTWTTLTKNYISSKNIPEYTFRIYFAGDSYLDSTTNTDVNKRLISSVTIPAKNDYATVEISLMEISETELFYEGTMPG